MDTKTNYITLNPDELNIQALHRLLTGGIAPRPIALVSTVSGTGNHNLAPFSFFNVFGIHPPYVAFSPTFSGRDGSAKDTLENILEVPQCVIHAVTYSMIHQVNLTSAGFPGDVNEFVKSNLTPMDSDIVKPLRVQESPFQMECSVDQVIPLGSTNGSGNLVLCRVLKFHVSEKIFQSGEIFPREIDLVGRNSGNYYTRARGDALFELYRPENTCIGIDRLPEYIKRSRILSAGNLAQLGQLTELPNEKEVRRFLKDFETRTSSSSGPENQFHEIFRSALSLPSDKFEESAIKIEESAKKAVENGDTDFAIKALLTLPLLGKRL